MTKNVPCSKCKTDSIMKLEKFRKHLHQNPELSNSEHQTAQRIIDFLKPLNPDQILTNVGGTGVVVIFKGKEPGDHVLFRCELDALPISEKNTFAHRSVVSGVSHKCGHDGHMAIICGLATKFAEDRSFSGQRILLFQPAEETGEGAIAVTEDEQFKALKIDCCYALHNLPGIPLGQVQIRPGTFNCASQGMSITFTGTTAHAAYPEKGRSPALAMVELLQQLTDITNEIDTTDLQMVTIIYSKMGEKTFGTTPHQAEIGVTLRTEKNAMMSKLKQLVLSKVETIAKQQQLEYSTQDHDVFMASVNNEECSTRVAQAAKKIGQDLVWLKEPLRWSEDFGAISSMTKGAMFILGAGEDSPQIHHPEYDFPDALIKPGIDIFYEIAESHQ